MQVIISKGPLFLDVSGFRTVLCCIFWSVVLRGFLTRCRILQFLYVCLCNFVSASSSV